MDPTTIPVDKLIPALWGLCATMLLQQIVALLATVTRPRRETSKEIIDAIASLQRSTLETFSMKYPPEIFLRATEQVREVHEVVVSGERKGAYEDVREAIVHNKRA